MIKESVLSKVVFSEEIQAGIILQVTHGTRISYGIVYKVEDPAMHNGVLDQALIMHRISPNGEICLVIRSTEVKSGAYKLVILPQYVNTEVAE